jgi:tetratricopeptide (TPR) repeat protein
MNMMEEDVEYLNLGQSLAGEEISYTGAKILLEGIEAGVVEQDEDNLNTLVQMYQMASEYDLAVEPATRVAEMSDSGDGYDQLGYLQYMLRDYEAAAEAFSNAIDKGNLTNASDTNLFYARALVELDQYDEAEAAARRAADLGDNSEQTAANSYITFIRGQAARYNAIQQRRQAVEEFMETYPSLL